ncbi:hypothetical protein NIES4101_56880 [Calothrix sp. NIES-4101]|nr:hypothetical protein NIES4101_56880 [Calothrix sp. NIES-4101]
MKIRLITTILGLVFSTSEVLLTTLPAYSQILPQNNSVKLLAQTNFPIKGSREDTVLSNRYMKTDITISNNGRIDGVTKTWSCNRSGFTGGVYIAVTDVAGNILNEPTQRRYGVNGKNWRGKCSSRTDAWYEQIPENKINSVHSVVI